MTCIFSSLSTYSIRKRFRISIQIAFKTYSFSNYGKKEKIERKKEKKRKERKKEKKKEIKKERKKEREKERKKEREKEKLFPRMS